MSQTDISHHNPHIVSADWLEARLGAPNLVILDASWYLPNMGRDHKKDYEQAHIPDALFFDLDVVVDPHATLPHTLPSPSDFARHVGEMGIDENSTIVIYDGVGYFSAPRAWWMFRIMGAREVYVLDGGLKAWLERGRAVTDKPTPIPTPKTFTPHFNRQAVVTFDEMCAIVAQKTAQIIDARGRARFSGQEKEARPGVRSGHMPGAYNVPYATLTENGYFKSADELRAIFASASVRLDHPIVTSCGSGVTAAILVLALQGLGVDHVRLYDGSWAEWGSIPTTAIEQTAIEQDIS